MEHPVKIAKLKALPVLLRASLVAQQLKNPPANAGDMGSTHSSILAWEIPRATEDEIVGWHHQLNGHEFEQTQGDSEGQGRLVCCSPWGHKELDMTEQLNNKCIDYLGEDLQYVSVFKYHIF